jgi:hypothetical protein
VHGLESGVGLIGAHSPLWRSLILTARLLLTMMLLEEPLRIVLKMIL